MIKNYVNLTNGIEALQQYKLAHYAFIRIQSTACEQHSWDKILQDLDYDFLMNVALGNECVIYDYGTRKPVPRAIYQGVEFIKYVLNRFWYNVETEIYISRSPLIRSVGSSPTPSAIRFSHQVTVGLNIGGIPRSRLGSK